ncbi:MAG: hypothetical protein BMS9Abin17_0820 [Acidimicrobiia bacterium]|nr:MAG: hypothetical protein BMS9Abin17_0820 [Acidimicrobiia bacterium]
MTSDPILTGQVIDTPTAQEFTRLALEKVSEHDLGDIASRLEAKSAFFREVFGSESIESLDEEAALAVLKMVFSARRKAKIILANMTIDGFKRSVRGLLYADMSPGDRLSAFSDLIDGIGRGVPEGTGHDLGSEILHFTDPNRYWLWTRWMWNPETKTGALPLVVMEEVDLDGGNVSETYRRIGIAYAFLNDVGEAAGFRTQGHGVFGTDVFLASVYSVYMYTTLRMRMTQEFNRIVPELGDLVQRLLGVNKFPAVAEVA